MATSVPGYRTLQITLTEEQYEQLSQIAEDMNKVQRSIKDESYAFHATAETMAGAAVLRWIHEYSVQPKEFVR